MAHLSCFNYKGFGEAKRKELWYSQAIRVGDKIECAGQGGWDPLTQEVKKDISEEIDQAFSNVDLALKTAGGKGWCQVYKINIYLTIIDEGVVGALVRNLQQWMPNHQPVMTAVGVAALGLEGMRVEIEVAAHDPEGAEKHAAEKAALPN
ncbi:Endoribonuclease L-PSP/chorismate mutase-like protein [Cladorrhinum samala]|uniref:Endoribonuclease L-PSP/chorismate mutase-like protein n=1 Tax=Cladorrhinum samala TaxID=585594 RepID=A0AAV9HZP0_9PEZI|nr:Endoribonuclease L-PSP/chorismate mutase-like protein [Cladorrhinum samala]